MLKKILNGLLLILIGFIFLIDKVNAQEEYNFSYTGSYQEFVAPYTGTYKLEVWGAQGGVGADSYEGGKGGYSKGYYHLNVGEKLYIYVGGEGTTITSGTGGNGYNGGGSGKVGTGSYLVGGGGGATDIRTTIAADGLWSNATSLASRIIVAGGGGGAGGYVGLDYHGGAGGGINGVNGSRGTSTSAVAGTGGTQVSGGYASGYTSTTGSFGTGGTGYSQVGSAGGGGGGYYGGGGGYASGAGGGSGYIGGVIDYNSDAALTLTGDQEIPNYNGLSTMTGNEGNGYAKITPVGLDLNFDFNIAGATIIASNSLFTFNVLIPYDNFETEITYTVGDDMHVLGGGPITLKNNTTHNLIVIDENNQVSIFELNIIVNKPYLNNVGFEEINFIFNSFEYDYFLEVENDVSKLTSEISSLYDYEIIGDLNLAYGENIIKIRAYADGMEDTIYTFHVVRDIKSVPAQVAYSYTGSYQEFVAPVAGTYKLEVWGAKGSNGIESEGGKGGYSKGYYYLDAGEKLYIYVGGQGTSITSGTGGGGYNGGGSGSVGTFKYAVGGGGGATDIRTNIVAGGLWSNATSLASRIIVAGGGGSAGSTINIDYTGGAGGGINGVTGSIGGNTSARAGTGGTQTAGGAASGYSSTKGTLGIGGTGYSGQGSAGGGGGGYYGGGGSFASGAGGGSGYIGGVTDYNGDAAVTIAGDEEMPTYDGTTTMVGNAGDGYAIISIPNSSNGYLASLSVSEGTMSPSFDANTFLYNVTLPADTEEVNITASLLNSEDELIGDGTVIINEASKEHVVAVISDNGIITTYNITFTKMASANKLLDNMHLNGSILEIFSPSKFDYEITLPYDTEFIHLDPVKGDDGQSISGDGLYIFDGNTLEVTILVVSENGDETQHYTFDFTREKSSKLKNIDLNNEFINYEFFSEVYEYNIGVPHAIFNLNVSTESWYEGTTVTITGHEYLEEDGGTITVTSSLDGVEPTVYILNYYKTQLVIDDTFEYVANYQEFVAPVTGTYKLEVWGAQGGAGLAHEGGKGGYSKGYYYLKAGEKLYVYVGGKGTKITSGTGGGGYNGGGSGSVGTLKYAVGGGGGATDIRTNIAADGLWSNNTSLASRIIVAGGGGGAGGHTTIDYQGGAGGGINGVTGSIGNNTSARAGTGGTQTAGGAASGYSSTKGTLGIGGTGYSGQGSAGGGGGGYYGGGGSFASGAGGGSGYIGGVIEYNGDVPQTIAGNTYIPTYDGTSTSVGNAGDGFARIQLIKEVSSNNYLESLVLNDGNIGLNFDKTVETYTLNLPSDTYTLNIDAIPANEYATVSGNGIIEVPPTEFAHNIIVTAEDGTIKTYTLNISRSPSSDSYPSNIELNSSELYYCNLSDEYCNYVFVEQTINYNITLPNEINNIELKAILKSSYQSVKYYQVVDDVEQPLENGEIVLSSAKEVYKIYVTSEDNSKTTIYTYTFTKDNSTNNRLASLEITNPSVAISDFSPTKYEYYVTIPSNYSSFTVNAIPENPDAKVQVKNNDNLKVGMNDCLIIVTAPNGNTKTYIIHAYKEQDTNVYLDSLNVINKDNNQDLGIVPIFDKTLNTYTINVSNDVKDINITGTTESSSATLEGNGDYTLKSGLNSYKLIVTNGENTNTYEINIIREKNNNPDLSSIVIDGYTLDPVFDKDTTEYSIEYEGDINSFDITVIPVEDTTTYTIAGNKNNPSEIVITSIAEDKTYKVYTIYAIKNLSDNNLLSGIELSSGKLNEDFESTVDDYTVTVGSDVKTITITGTPEDPTATVVGNGMYSLVSGKNTITLEVISATGESKFYTIVVTREADNDATLKSVTNNQNSEVSIPEDTTLGYDYLINVQYEVNQIEITGIPNSSKATVVGNRTYSLKVGNNDITLSVTAENGTTENYKVRVVRDASDNDDLDFLYVHEGGLSPIFNETTIYYEVKVPNDATMPLTIEAIPEDTNATYEIIGNDGTLEVGVAKEIIVRVTAQKGNTKDYTLSVTRQAATEENLALESLITNRGEVQPTFSPDTLNYTLEVENEISDITVTGTALSEDVTVKGNGTYNLNVGKNAIPIFVIGTDGVQRDYQIVVTRKKSKDASLANLVVKSHTLSPTFTSATTSYSLTTSNTSLEFTTITPTETEATYEIIGNENFTTGENTVTIRVTAPDGETTQDYVLTVTRTGSKNNNLASLSVEGYTLTPNFHKGVTFYAVEVANDLNSIIINATAEDTTASIDGIGLKTITTGENYFDIVVTSETGATKTYTILVTKEASDNNYLASLRVSEGDLTPDFDKLENNYEITVPYDVDKIEIYGSTEDASATIDGLGIHNLEVGENTIKVVVTSESGIENIYEIKITREAVNSANLLDLEVVGYDLDSVFNKDVLEYYVTVNSEITFVEIKYVKEDQNATVEITGNENFDIGMNEVKLTVIASDGVTTKEYILYVNRMLSTNNYLEYIIIDKGTLNPIFNPYTLKYTVNVDSDVETININAQVQDSASTITSGVGTHTLNKGDNKIEIKVKSMIGVTRTYTINVTRKMSDNNYLKDLKVVNNNQEFDLLPSFDKLVNNYTLNLSGDDNYINILATAEDELANINNLGFYSVPTGNSTIDIVVISESGRENTYTLNINKAPSSNNFLTMITPSSGTLSPTFAKDTTEYTLNIVEDISSLAFEVELESSKATVTGHEIMPLVDGETIRKIVVTAEDGTTKTYTITVNKEGVSNALLESLTIKDYPFEFDSDTFIYNVSVSGSKRELLASEITAIPKDSEATVNLMGDIKLSEGIINVYTIEVIAKDGYTTQEYILNITRDSELYTLRSDIYEIIRDDEEDYVTKISVTKLENFKNSFKNENEYLKVYKDDTEIVDEVNIGTGYIIKLEINNVVYDTLRIIVTGDVTGDGKVDVSDSVDLNNVILKKKVFEGITFKAGDVTSDGKIDVSDSVKLNNYILKKIASLVDEES